MEINGKKYYSVLIFAFFALPRSLINFSSHQLRIFTKIPPTTIICGIELTWEENQAKRSDEGMACAHNKFNLSSYHPLYTLLVPPLFGIIYELIFFEFP